jgi:hypothetical protein
MKKMLFAAVTMSLLLVMSGCGGGNDVVVVLDSPPPSFKTSIPSNPAFDGDILNGMTLSPLNSPSLFAGIEPFTPYDEYRAFLVFPLTGAGGVPGSAHIDAATLDIFIDSITLHPLAGSIPIRIELASYAPETLQPSYYYRTNLPPLAYTTIIPPITSADVLHRVSIDVTSLMAEAQFRGLANFQIRILQNDGFVYPGLIEINDTNAKAPMLEVVYH